MIPWRRRVTLVNARVAAENGVAPSVRFGTGILEIGRPPHPKDVVVDVGGAYVLPGLINAHDHLELNHYGRIRPRPRYANASDWIDDLRPLLRSEPRIVENSRHSLRSRLLVGAVKNLLSGVTTTAHHNPWYPELDWHVPLRVLRRYGWAHSIAMQGRPVGARGEPGDDIRAGLDRTPPDAPFFVHAAEGTDAAAADELRQLDRLGCVRGNTVLVHGTAIDREGWRLMASRGASLVWCPASNEFLFGASPPVRDFLDDGSSDVDSICLGTDSRLTGSQDLLDELRAAARIAPVTPHELLRMVTVAAARVLRLPHGGRLAVGVPADLIVIPPLADSAAETLLACERRDLLLVLVGGQPVIGAPELEPVFKARRTAHRRMILDSRERIVSRTLGSALARCAVAEAGVQCH